ncbi:hypothetical protein COHA_010007 [Chlorella ohadii]|uniref:Uncharacterized protein n=1 Tax=Chlorella ohadii TaxID=2649997 RepID=A0AAD5H0Y9_9CHLO|nr:hypothetical protein COHA_010007 [Chlorella ohadii]
MASSSSSRSSSSGGSSGGLVLGLAAAGLAIAGGVALLLSGKKDGSKPSKPASKGASTPKKVVPKRTPSQASQAASEASGAAAAAAAPAAAAPTRQASPACHRLKAAAAEKSAAEKAAAAKAAADKAAADKAVAEKAAAEKAAAKAAKAAAAPVAAPAAEAAPAAAEAEQEAEAEAEAEEVVHEMPSGADIAALVLPADAVPAKEQPADEPLELLSAIPVPPLSFSSGASAEADDLNELESKARNMSLHAHKLVKDNNNLVQGSKEQKAALDLLLAPENAGKARPHLVAACAFALGDMMLAQKKVDETKRALAIAYQTAAHIDDKGPQVRALMNYAYILKSERKAASTRATYDEALTLARTQHGATHGMVEKIKYELTAFLGTNGREAEAANMLISSAAELLNEAERLAAEEAAKPAEQKEAEKKKAKEEAASKAAANGSADEPPSGLEHVAGEGQGEEEEEEGMTPAQTAQHFAMRNLMNAAGVLDGLQQYERGQELLGRAADIAVCAWGPGSMQHLNVLYALAQHFRRRGMIQESIDFHEQVLAIMDESIQVYSPELLQNRIAILRDTAVLLDKVGQAEAAVDYATGALVNAQTLAGIMSGQQRATQHPILEPFYRLLADLKEKIGDEAGAAECRRMANAGRLSQRMAAAGGKQQQQRQQKAGAGGRKSGTGASTARAGGRRV